MKAQRVFRACILALPCAAATWSPLFAPAIVAQTPNPDKLAIHLSDPSGAVVANGDVSLKNDQTGKIYKLPLDRNKEFVLPGLSPGSYRLIVDAPGFRKVEQPLELTDTTRSPIQIVLQVAGSSTTVSVTDSAARDESYEVARNTTASRVDLALLDIPQDVATVPRAVLQDQRVMNLSDATRNVAGAATDFGFNGGSEPLIILRGFQSTSMTAQGTMSGMSSYYVDGTKVEGIPVDMADVQTVEVIKGPETVLYAERNPAASSTSCRVLSSISLRFRSSKRQAPTPPFAASRKPRGRWIGLATGWVAEQLRGRRIGRTATLPAIGSARVGRVSNGIRLPAISTL